MKMIRDVKFMVMAIALAGLTGTVQAAPDNLEGMNFQDMQNVPTQFDVPRARLVSDADRPTKEFERFSRLINKVIGSIEHCRDSQGNYVEPCGGQAQYHATAAADDFIKTMTNVIGYQNEASKARFGEVADYKRTRNAMRNIQCSTVFLPGEKTVLDGQCMKTWMEGVLATLDR